MCYYCSQSIISNFTYEAIHTATRAKPYYRDGKLLLDHLSSYPLRQLYPDADSIRMQLFSLTKVSTLTSKMQGQKGYHMPFYYVSQLILRQIFMI